MAFFINKYDTKDNAYFRAAIHHDIGDDFHLVGLKGDNGIFAKIDRNGNVQMLKDFSINEKSIYFTSGVRADNEDFLLHGSVRVSSRGSSARNNSLIIRIDSAGNVIWSKMYHQDKTRYNIKLIKSVKDTYFFTSWLNVSGTTDNVEVIKIDGSGNVLAAANIGTNADDQVSSAIPHKDGIILFGGTSAGPGWDSFVIYLDKNLGIVWKKLLGNNVFQDAHDMVSLGDDSFVISGFTGNNRDSFIAFFNPNSTSTIANIFNFVDNLDNGVQKIVFAGGKYYLGGTSTSTWNTYVARFDANLTLEWVKYFDLDEDYEIRDMINVGQGGAPELLFPSISRPSSGNNKPLLMYTDKELNSCSTVSRQNPENNRTKFSIKDWETQVKKFDITGINLKVLVKDISSTTIKICPSESIDLDSNPLFQSPYIYLQAAGSDFSDNTVHGFHLRWDLLKSLGESHLPKGDLAGASGAYTTNIGFNRGDDFVRIYKTEFKTDYGVEANLSNPPSALTESGSTREWVYQNLVPIASLPTHTSDIALRFVDIAQYDAIRASINPATNPDAFLQNYTGILETEVVGKLSFMVDINLQRFSGGGGQSSDVKIETISNPDSLDSTTEMISTRVSYAVDDTEPIFCENIEYMRFSYVNAYPTSIRFAAYEDFMLGTNLDDNWSKIGDYSLDDGLSDNNSEVFNRLEDLSKFTIHNTWPKFNEVVPGNGEFRVNVENYQDRWTFPVDGLKEAVITFLNASITDLQANVIHPNQDPNANNSAMEVSYLDMLNFVSLDFHVARMLGLGTIDPSQNPDPTIPDNTKYVYLMQYITEAQLENETPQLVSHFYMTPPLSVKDYKLPPSPVLDPVSYGIFAQNKTGNPTPLTGPGGYSLYDPSRFVNLNKQPFRYETPFESFFFTPDEFHLCDETIPVLFGVEYADGTGTPTSFGPYVRPEINNDPDYKDPDNVFGEVIPIPETGENPIFIHRETNPGFHHYGLYSINWFSRVSPISDPVNTDNTQFPKRNSIIPPSNIMAQLIQVETPLMFTSGPEQTMLANIATADKTLVRVTFDWNEVHNDAYQDANKVVFSFRQNEPTVVRGAIQSGGGSIVVNTIDHTVTVKTESFLIASTNPPQTIQPNITTPGIFIGARFVSNGREFIVDQIITTGNDPTIRLHQIRQTELIDVNNDGIFCTVENWLSPDEGDHFFLVESLDDPNNWDQQLTKEVDITHFAPTHTETIVNSDGTTRDVFVGGLLDTASIVERMDTDPVTLALVPSGGPSAVPTGVYDITFDTKQLASHGQVDVDYYQGTIRLKDVNNEIKVLRIWEIDNSTLSTLKLVAYDATFGLKTDPFTGNFDLDGSLQFQLVTGYTPILVGSGQFVNFHPSYRVYLKFEGAFEDDNILPAAGEGNRKTYLGVRAKDDTVSPDCVSYYPTPSVIIAREIIEPEQPGTPSGPMFATRPNFYGKASYTFDVAIDNPYALIFYRANEQKILDQLYATSTVKQILADLEALESPDADFFNDRWSGLVNMDLDGSFQFKEYTSGGYRFPMPDNPDYIIPHPDSSVQVNAFNQGLTMADNLTYFDPVSNSNVTISMVDVVKDAIDGAFLPLNEIPPIFAHLEQSNIQTSERKPSLLQPNGEKASFGDAGYDPWPMAIRFEKNALGDIITDVDAGYGTPANSRFVRFTDYTIDGAAKNIYFYFGVGMNNTLHVSDRSDVFGPIQLVNSSAPESPKIKSVSSQQTSDHHHADVAITFELNPYLNSENVSDIQIYRTSSPENSLSPRNMDLAKTIEIGEQSEEGIIGKLVVQDDFSDLSFIPFGDPLFYRLVALRKITNEQGIEEKVPSKFSDRVLTSIADSSAPLAPDIVPSIGAITATQIQNVQLSWDIVAHNSTYTLRQYLNGNWEKLTEITSNNPVDLTFTLPTDLERFDAGGAPLRHLFRVDVVNSSGLVNPIFNELAITANCEDLLQLIDPIAFEDSFHSSKPLSEQVIDDLESNPGTLTFTDQSNVVTRGHVFDHIDITVEDGLGGSHTLTINSPGGDVTFNHGDGGLSLDSSNNNLTYTVTSVIYTDLCLGGASKNFLLDYTYDPCTELQPILTPLVLEDATGVLGGILSLELDNGQTHPGFLKFTDQLTMPGNQIFGQIDIEVRDNLGNSHVQSITTVGGDVTFNHGDGGLVLDASNPNASIIVIVTLISDKCSAGAVQTYILEYV